MDRHVLLLVGLLWSPGPAVESAPRCAVPCRRRAQGIAQLRVLADSYGADDRLALLDAVERLQREGLKEMREYGKQRISPYWKFLAGNEFATRHGITIAARQPARARTGVAGIVGCATLLGVAPNCSGR